MLRFGLGGLSVVAGAVTLGACGAASSTSNSSTSTTSPPSGGPKRGGTLRIGVTGGGSEDSLDGQVGLNSLDLVRVRQLFDTLTERDLDFVPQPALAESVTPNSSATEWTIHLRKGVTFHDGKDVTAEDVIFSLQRVFDPKLALAGSSLIALVDPKSLKKLDNYTVRLSCRAPYSTLPVSLSDRTLSILPVGFDPRNPIGTGPYKYKSFTPGVTSTFVRNDDYWISGLPYTDAVVIDDSSDETSQVNALLSGQLDLIAPLSAASVAGIKASAGHEVLAEPSPFWIPITMRVDRPPFNDVRVRQAMRLIVDRPQMLEAVYSGYGMIGNDLFGIFDPEYDSSLPQRHQDIPQARSLLKAAGHEGLTIQMVTSDIATGAVEIATVFKQQAAQAGVTINLSQVTSTSFFGSSYLKYVFAEDFWEGYNYLEQVASGSIPGAPYNETHWDDPHYTQLYYAGLATTDMAKQTEIVHEMCTIDYDQGGYIIPVYSPFIHGYSSRVHGLVRSKSGLPAMEWSLKNIWLD